MIFSADLLAKVLDGSKTQTRRPARSPFDTPCIYKVGRTYAVQPGRGQHAVGRILIRSVDCVAVCAISTPDAIAEGFASGVDFMDRWRELYGNVDGDCWRIQFALEAALTAAGAPFESEDET